MLDFWIRVKKLMVADLTQSWLCDEAGISVSTLSGWIGHDRIPPADKAQKIADALGVTVEYLVTGKEPYSDETKALTRIDPTDSPKEILLCGYSSDDGIPYYNVEVTAHIADVFTEAYTPQYFIYHKSFLGCDLCMPVIGDSMEPKISSGDIVFLKRLKRVEDIQWGEMYVVTTYNGMNLVALKRVLQDDKGEGIILKSINPDYPGNKFVPNECIDKLYLVVGAVTQFTMVPPNWED